MKIPKLSASPTMVPTRTRLGFSGSAGGGGGGGAGTTATGATASCGGRREAENIGRSRVAVSADSGMAQSGLALVGAGSLDGATDGATVAATGGGTGSG